MKTAMIAATVLSGAKAVNIDGSRRHPNHHGHHEDHEERFEHLAALHSVYPECVPRDAEWGLVPCYTLDNLTCDDCQWGRDIHCMWSEDQDLCTDWTGCTELDPDTQTWEPVECESIEKAMECRQFKECGCEWNRNIRSCHGTQ